MSWWESDLDDEAAEIVRQILPLSEPSDDGREFEILFFIVIEGDYPFKVYNPEMSYNSGWECVCDALILDNCTFGQIYNDLGMGRYLKYKDLTWNSLEYKVNAGGYHSLTLLYTSNPGDDPPSWSNIYYRDWFKVYRSHTAPIIDLIEFICRSSYDSQLIRSMRIVQLKNDKDKDDV